MNQAVARNKERFPEDFYFKLMEKEYFILMSQCGTTKKEKRGGRQCFPYAFT